MVGGGHAGIVSLLELNDEDAAETGEPIVDDSADICWLFWKELET